MCNVSQVWTRRFCTMLLLLGVPVLMTLPRVASAQSLISGDLGGTVTDPSGAAIQGATVTAKSNDTGAVKTVTTGGAGDYRIGLLQPGSYTVTVAAANFQTTQQTVNVAVGNTTTVSVSLPLAKGATTVQVLGESVPLLQTENSDISTTLTQEQVQNLPNPGGDITYYIQLTQGVVMNTQMHYGNSSAFGLPATSNNFTVNGAEDNDPFLNLNNSGPSNLLLGSNDVGEVNIVANAYSAQYGALGGVQENITTRSGTNSFHGDAVYYWANSDMEANDWFNKNTGAPEPYANANQWGVAGGGPIVKDKTFFFANYEGAVCNITGGCDVLAQRGLRVECEHLWSGNGCRERGVCDQQSQRARQRRGLRQQLELPLLQRQQLGVRLLQEGVCTLCRSTSCSLGNPIRYDRRVALRGRWHNQLEFAE